MSAHSLEAYRGWLRDSIAPVVRGWCPEAVSRQYAQATEQFMAWTSNDDVSRGYARARPVVGVDRTLYRLRGGCQRAARSLPSPQPRRTNTWSWDRWKRSVALLRQRCPHPGSSFHVARPDLKDAVPVSTLEALVACAEVGGLYGCFAGPELLAVLALKPDTRYGVDAWWAWDIVLARRYCGKGLAAALQRAVLDRLNAVQAPLVAGTIHASNLPSLRAALRVARQIVGTWIFVRS